MKRSIVSVLGLVSFLALFVFVSCEPAAPALTTKWTISGEVTPTVERANLKLAAFFGSNSVSSSSTIVSNVVSLANNTTAQAFTLNIDASKQSPDDDYIVLHAWVDTNDNNVLDSGEDGNDLYPLEGTNCPGFGVYGGFLRYAHYNYDKSGLLYSKGWNQSIDLSYKSVTSAVKTGLRLQIGLTPLF